MLPQLLATASAQFGVFTTAQARRCGYSRTSIQRLVDNGSWRTVRRGVHTALPGDDHAIDVAAALLALNRDGLVAAHTSAAVLWDLDWLGQPDLGSVHLAHPLPGTVRSYPGLRVTPVELPRSHVVRAQGLPRTSIARTVVDLARALPFRDAVVLADSALRRTQSGRTDLDAVLATCRTWCGGRRAAAVVEFADGLAESPAESLARVVLAELGLPKPQLQVKIHDAAGFVGRVDMLIGDVVVEVDGKSKYTDPEVLWARSVGRIGCEPPATRWSG